MNTDQYKPQQPSESYEQYQERLRREQATNPMPSLDENASNADRQKSAEMATATDAPPDFLKTRKGGEMEDSQRRDINDRAKRKAKRIAERQKRLSKMKDEFGVLFAGLGPRFSIDELVNFAGQNSVEVLFNKVTADTEDADPPASTTALELSAMSDEPVVNAHIRLTGQQSSVIPPQNLTEEEAREQSERMKELQVQRRERDTKGPVDMDKDPITGVLPPPIPGAESRAPNEPVTVTKGVGQA